MSEVLTGLIVFFITAPISAYLGYIANIRQDKRKEFNELAEPILLDLIRHTKNYLLNKQYTQLKHNDFEHDNISRIYDRISHRRKMKLDKLFNSYIKAHNNIIHKSKTELSSKDYEEAFNKLNKLEEFFKLK